MLMTPLLILHVGSAIVGLLAGFLAMALRKGSGLHGAAGNVFFVSMLSVSTSAACLAAFHKPNMLNVVVSLLTAYLAATAWRAARNRQGEMNFFDIGALLFILAVGTAVLGLGFEAASSPIGLKERMPAAAYFIFGSIALLCAVSDARMVARGNLTGAKRIARHLWRMSLALLITTISFYPGQARLFPMWLRETRLLLIPAVLVVGSMLFWRYRISRRQRVELAGQRTAVARVAGRGLVGARQVRVA